MQNLGDLLVLTAALPTAARTATGLSPAIDISQYKGEIAVIRDMAAGTGTSPTMSMKLVESDSANGTYTDVVGGAFANLTTVAALEKLSLNSDELKSFIKVSYVIGGTTPVYTGSVNIAGTLLD